MDSDRQQQITISPWRQTVDRWRRSGVPVFVMTVIIIWLGFMLLYPALIIIVNTFNTAPDMFLSEKEWGLDNWRSALDQPLILKALWNTIMIWGLTVGVSFPIAVLVAWTLARTNIPFSHTIEFMFWVAYMLPSISTTIAWILVLDPDFGMVNTAIAALPFIDHGPFNIFSVPGIIWANIMANGIAIKVMLLTPAFRNMDAALEEAGRVSGASNFRTMFRVTLPLMISPMVLVLALQMVRIFQSFEIEQLLGVPFNFFVYSTMIFGLARQDPPAYGEATVLASLTLAIVALLIPMQRWILQRRRYTTISSSFRPGLVDLGPWRFWVYGLIFVLVFLLTLFPASILLLGSFMSRVGWFDLTPVFTFKHWIAVLGDPIFLKAFRTTMVLGVTAAIISPMLFITLAYILVRTGWYGRGIVDTIIWTSAAIPGILSGLGLLSVFLGTPGLSIIYGTIYALIIVVVISGKTTGVNISKGVLVQLGPELEEAARVAGAGSFRTFFAVVVPLMMPTLVLLAVLNFTSAAGATSSVILLASRETQTLSILTLNLMSSEHGDREAAAVVALIIIFMTVGIAILLRTVGSRFGVHHEQWKGSRDRSSRPAAEEDAAQPVGEPGPSRVGS